MSAASRPLAGRAVVCVGFADWDADVWTNQQHLMSRLAPHATVLFVESLGLRRPQLAGRDVRRMARRLLRGLSPPRERDGVHVLSPLVVPWHSRPRLRALNAALLRAAVRRATRRLGMDRPVLWAYVPQAEALLGTLDPALVVYHCVDDIAATPGIDAAGFRAAEERFARRADLVLASAPPLAARLRGLGAEVRDAPNVADVGAFAPVARGEVAPDAAVAALPGPRAVFVGAVTANKLDLDLLAAVARARPSWSFALVGPHGLGDPSTDVSALAALPNVHLLGARTRPELPGVLAAADAGLIPYADTPLTASIFPMKVYEYLAAGVPVVSTPLPSLAGVEGIVRADGPEAFAAALDTALADGGPEARGARSALAAGHSWDTRLAEIDGWVRAAEGRRAEGGT